jgi:serine/threonine protein kinase
VVTGERVKLLDFGIAKLLTDTGGLAKTTTGAIVGTPYYMSPEQCEGSRSVDAKSDLYALGIILFQMISGRLPFEGGGLGGILGAHQFVPAPGLRTVAPDAPAEVEAFVARLLSKAPGRAPGLGRRGRRDPRAPGRADRPQPRDRADHAAAGTHAGPAAGTGADAGADAAADPRGRSRQRLDPGRHASAADVDHHATEHAATDRDQPTAARPRAVAGPGRRRAGGRRGRRGRAVRR